MGTEAVPGTAVCAGGNGWKPKHSGKYQPGIESAVHHSALQLSLPDQIYVQGVKIADGGIRLPFLVKIYAKNKLLPEKRGTCIHGTCTRRKALQKSAGSCPRHGNAHGSFLHCNRDSAEPFYLLYWEGSFQPNPLPENPIQGKSF